MGGKYTAQALGLIGMVAYPLLGAGLAFSVGHYVHPLAGWLVAIILAGLAGLPKLNHDLDAASAARAQAAWKGRGDPVVIAPVRPIQATGTTELGQPLGPQVADPWTSPPGG